VTTADLLRSLLPPVAYDPYGKVVGAVMKAEANALTAAEDRASSVADAMHPGTAGEDIADWERFLALTPRPDANQGERVQAVRGKLGELGGLSSPYFIRLAAASGYDITIFEPQPWRVGHSSVAEPLYPEDVVFVWQVQIHTRPEGVDAAMDAALEQRLIDLKPGYTYCQFLESQRAPN
jgi:uncharacterized protein YmfQ (DUF2313 family)